MAESDRDNGASEPKKQREDTEDDDFNWEEGYTDLTLIVEGKPIHVNRGFLMTTAPYFKTMLLSGFKEKDAKKISLPEIKYNEMREFLRFLRPDKSRDFTEENIDFLIRLASFYQSTQLEKRCEDYLLGKYADVDSFMFSRVAKTLPSRHTSLQHIHYGINHGCKKLETKAKKHLSKCCLKDIDKDDHFVALPLEYKLEIYQNRINTIEDRYHEDRSGHSFSDIMLQKED